MRWWALQDLNLQPTDYESAALTIVLRARHRDFSIHAWCDEIAATWRFTRKNGIADSSHTRMELINRQAYGFRNFHNYGLRVKVQCA